ncbi:hypothetical protein VNO77_01210 [Canavalia gladiata]|uniref:Uncharacterized protein n=1 Tax=Canavalia gladiata TaxID=3824 RepID=A0AAN9MW31_CANGL
MLDMGFEPQVRKIVEQMDMPPPGVRQTVIQCSISIRDTASFDFSIYGYRRELIRWHWLRLNGFPATTIHGDWSQQICLLHKC